MQNASDIILNSQSQLLNGLEGGTTYYWRVRSINSSGETSAYSNIEKFTPEHTTGITGTNEIPSTFLLKQNYPNPFNPSTILEFSIPVAGNYTLDVYNVLGEKVTTLLNTTLNPGTFKVAFNGKNFSSGVYFYRLSGNKVNIIRKMLMLK